jgi:hypothetical protein
MEDADWLHFYFSGAIFQYMFGNGILNSLQFIFASILVRDTLPSHHIPVFALGSIITDILARYFLLQSVLSVTSLGLLMAGLCCFAALFRTFTPAERSTITPKVVIFGISVALLLHIIIFGSYFLAQDHQPIISLIDQAGLQFKDYENAARSQSLRGAVNEYNRRYGRPPPPGFDIWYQFATDRGVRVIHEYDQIVEDLRPFWGIEPKVLRERVARVASNDWNNFAQIRIRGGKPEVGTTPQWRVYPSKFGFVDG